MRHLKRALTGLLLAIGLACPSHGAEPVRIGEMNSYRAVPAFTVPYRNGWQLAVNEINAGGGVLGGRPLVLVSRDDGAKRADALAVAQDLVDKEGVGIIVGSFLSNIGLALSEFARRNRIVYLAAMPMTDDLVWAKGNRYTFRLRASSYMQANMLAERAALLPAKRWAVIAPDYEFGRSVAANFEACLQARRPDVRFVAEQWPALGGLDPRKVVPPLLQANPDAIFNATFGSDLGRLVHDGNGLGLFAGRSVVSILTGEPEILDSLADEAPEGWIVTGYPWYAIATAEHRKFVEAYRAAYDEDPRMASLLGYALVKALAAAIDKAGGTAPDKLIKALEGLSFATPVGPVTVRAADHQATLGTWVGTTAIENGGGIMVDWTYDDGETYLPDPEQARRKRPADADGGFGKKHQ
jgi:branched-chain amino acid transport system substrate-binding protein